MKLELPHSRRALPRWRRGLHAIEDVVRTTLLLGLLGLAVSQIVLRVAFDTGLLWSEPVSRLMVLWLALLGGLSATREQRHIAIDAFPRLLPRPARVVAWWLAQAGAAVICGLLTWYSIGMIELELEAPTYLVGRFPNWIGMLVLPFGFGLMALRFLLAAFAGPDDLQQPESGMSSEGEGA